MKRFVWCTDVHLNFLSDAEIVKFALDVRENLMMPVQGEEPGGVFITGDISEAPTVSRHLTMLEKVIAAPIYFVLGNHDYYKSSFSAVHAEITTLSANSQFLKWLPAVGVVSLGENTALVGHDGWYDMLNGDWQSANFYMIDWKLIHDYIPVDHSKAARASLSAKITQQAADYLEKQLEIAFQTHQNAVVLTHVPPWEKAAQYMGKPTDRTHLPFFSNKLVGEALERVMQKFSDKNLTVLAGHTHDQCHVSIARNITCMVGGAQYHYPKIENFIYV